MKTKILILFLVSSTITLSITTIFYYVESKNRAKVIANRELTITNYKKVINAIGKSGGVSINRLKKELKKEFQIEKMEYESYAKEYYYPLFPKKHAVNHKEVWMFMGLELILDEQKKFKTVNLYKP